jgi:glycosyltransferase involved in cell wall biosynthesis
MTLHDFWFICPKIQLLTNEYVICDEAKHSGKKCFKCYREGKVKEISNYLKKYHLPNKFMKSMIRILFNQKNSQESFNKRKEEMKRNILKIDQIIAPSQFLRNVFIEYGIPEDKITFSENGYNLELFTYFKKKEKKSKKIIFGFVGGIQKHKGIHIMTDAFSDIDKEKAELRIYGKYDPKESYVMNLQKKSKEVNNISFEGEFDDIKLPFSEIDVLITPSIWNETGGPLVIREALATKTPVIASRVGSIPELVFDDVNGLLFNINDSKDLNKKILKIIDHPELIKKFQSNIKTPRSMEEQSKEIANIFSSRINPEGFK